MVDEQKKIAIDALRLALAEIEAPGSALQLGRNARLAIVNALFALGVPDDSVMIDHRMGEVWVAFSPVGTAA